MADAGKVAILPRGLWSAETVYEPLDLVYYNNNSFVALKESVGVTPVDGDTWMLSLSGISQETIEEILNGTQQVGDSAKLGGKDASEYALVSGTYLTTSILEYALTVQYGTYFIRLGGDSYNGNDLPSSNYKYGTANINKRGNNAIEVILWGAISTDARRIAVNFYNGSSWSGWDTDAKTSDLADYLPLSGGELKGAFETLLTLHNIFAGETSNTVNMVFKLRNTILGILGFDTDGTTAKPYVRFNGSSTRHELLHTGNKPTGTYTGNGDATKRTIITGSISSNYIVREVGSGAFALLTLSGYIGKGTSGVVHGSDCLGAVGLFSISTSNSLFNTDGKTYEYYSL